MTHQDILDRIEQLETERDATRARINKELASLRELCGGIGHRLGAQETWRVVQMGHKDAYKLAVCICTVCGQHVECGPYVEPEES